MHVCVFYHADSKCSRMSVKTCLTGKYVCITMYIRVCLCAADKKDKGVRITIPRTQPNEEQRRTSSTSVNGTVGQDCSRCDGFLLSSIPSDCFTQTLLSDRTTSVETGVSCL